MYADGDVEKLWLVAGIERVRVVLPAQAQPDLPSAVDLHNLAQILLKQSHSMEGDPGKRPLISQWAVGTVFIATENTNSQGCHMWSKANPVN